MVIQRIELCINLVRMAIEFVMVVAETVVNIQERTTESLVQLNRPTTHVPLSGFLP
ncbi:hypothetical protein L6164_035638 [Bauhinia variegata]|uniref:Uncharacterized protein n=1 Tax=Bauhinia variegata TaxID=167791 RepID=A0ACB9KEL2_BAUVA|nr:hypothetical protein L6164_035638 [Bauhinia variegata]